MNAKMATASASEKRKPQVRELWFGSNMKCGSEHAVVFIKQDFKVAVDCPEVAGSEIPTDEQLSSFGLLCAHNMIRRRKATHEHELRDVGE